LRARYNPATLRRNVNPSDCLVMTTKLVDELEVVSRLAVELDVVVSSDSDGLAISSEGVVGNWCMEEVVDFWAGHRDCGLMLVGRGYDLGGRKQRRSSLLLLGLNSVCNGRRMGVMVNGKAMSSSLRVGLSMRSRTGNKVILEETLNIRREDISKLANCIVSRSRPGSSHLHPSTVCLHYE